MVDGRHRDDAPRAASMAEARAALLDVDVPTDPAGDDAWPQIEPADVNDLPDRFPLAWGAPTVRDEAARRANGDA